MVIGFQIRVSGFWVQRSRILQSFNPYMKLRQNGTVSFSIKLGAHRPAAGLNGER
jgi:hypothetical protein